MKKSFDCVEMKHNAAEKIHEQLKNLTHKEKTSYWVRRNEIFKQEQKDLV